MVHLLIVDDEPNVASSLALLQRTGYQTTIANSAKRHWMRCALPRSIWRCSILI
jgi:CheY-like chemotaxis protein